MIQADKSKVLKATDDNDKTITGVNSNSDIKSMLRAVVRN